MVSERVLACHCGLEESCRQTQQEQGFSDLHGNAYACSSHANTIFQIHHMQPCKNNANTGFASCKYNANTMQESHAATSAICKYICRSQFLHAFTYASPDWCICKSHASVSSLNTSRAQICRGAPGRIAGDSKNMCANPGSNPVVDTFFFTDSKKNVSKNVHHP